MKHFRTFEKFLLENTEASVLTKEQIDWCNRWMGERWTSQDKGEIEVRGDVTFKNMKDEFIPVQFGEYVSNFTFNACTKLKSLKGSPSQVSIFTVLDCPSLESLEGSPRSAYGCQIKGTSIKNLSGMPSEVTNTLMCDHNPLLESFEGCFQTKVSHGGILYEFSARSCPKIKTIFGAPLSENYMIDTENIVNLVERKWIEEKNLEMIHLWLSSKLPIEEFLEKKKGLLSAKKFGL